MNRAALLILAALALLSTPAEARFRFDEIEERDFTYNDEYFINAALNSRERVSIRWRWDDGWDNAAIGYRVSPGSVRSAELHIDHEARIRLPFTNFLTGQYYFFQGEDYDSRYEENEVEVLFRLFRPEKRLPLTQSVGRTPVADGLFFGGTGNLDQDKEFADMGFAGGYRGENFAIRLDAIKVDFFYNDKNGQGGEYEEEPYTLKLEGQARFLGGDLRTTAWFHEDLPLTLVLPERDGGLRFRYRQRRAGGRVAWQPRHDVRFDVEFEAEETHKRRQTNNPDPLLTDDLDRYAAKGWIQGEVDVAPTLETASHHSDVIFFGLFAQALQEVTRRPLDPNNKHTLHRGEAYAELGYLLSIPSPSDLARLGVRGSVSAGFLSYRDVDASKHSVGEKFIAKLGAGFEAVFLDGNGYVFFNFTYRADDPSFGGGNVQVLMRF